MMAIDVKQVLPTPLKMLISILRLLFVASVALFASNAKALVLTPYFESILVPSVSTSWTTVALDNSYANAIPVCTYVLGTFAGGAGSYTHVPAVTRIKNITSSSFQLRIQGWEDGPASTSDVHCMVMDEGAHTLPDGRLVEAHSVVSDKTSGQYSTDGGWNQTILEDVSGSIVHSYNQPVVVGQVMSYNDSRASVIYLSDCDNRANEPFNTGMADGICVGKHIGMISGARASETIGYIVGETGSGTLNNVFYELAMGADSVAGKNTGDPGYTYAGLARHHTMAVLTQAAEDGGNGSWAVLYGTTPLSNGAIKLAVDEEAYAGDTSRKHTNERVYYWAFAGAEITNNDDALSVLTLAKVVNNNAGGEASGADFTLFFNGEGVTGSGISGASSVTGVTVPSGDYTLSENTVPGYELEGINCDGADSIGTDGLTINPGEIVICTFINADKGVDLIIEKSANNASPKLGDSLTFTIDIKNEGPDTATDVQVLDRVTAGFSYVASSITGGDVQNDSSPTSPGLEWTINTLLAGATVTLTFQATVLAP